jgi:hypothetical protein
MASRLLPRTSDVSGWLLTRLRTCPFARLRATNSSLVRAVRALADGFGARCRAASSRGRTDRGPIGPRARSAAPAQRIRNRFRPAPADIEVVVRKCVEQFRDGGRPVQEQVPGQYVAELRPTQQQRFRHPRTVASRYDMDAFVARRRAKRCIPGQPAGVTSGFVAPRRAKRCVPSSDHVRSVRTVPLTRIAKTISFPGWRNSRRGPGFCW